MRLPLVYYDHPTLRKKAIKIESITDAIKQLANDLTETMIYHNGVGLAAPQVGISLRIFVIRDEQVGVDGSFHFGAPEVLINPILSHPSEEKEVMAEGCLSIPGVHAEVIRPSRIHVRYQTVDGELKEEEVSQFRARVMMHENDHINGVLFIDRLTKEERLRIKPLLNAIIKKYHSHRSK